MPKVQLLVYTRRTLRPVHPAAFPPFPLLKAADTTATAANSQPSYTQAADLITERSVLRNSTIPLIPSPSSPSPLLEMVLADKSDIPGSAAICQLRGCENETIDKDDFDTMLQPGDILQSDITEVLSENDAATIS